MRAAWAGQCWWIAITLGFALAACSGNTNRNAPTNQGGQANVSGAGGGSAGSASGAGGASGAGDATPGGSAGMAGGAAVTKYQACVEYLNAQCNRRYFECSGYPASADPCPEYLGWCPDFLFSEGSQLDVAGVLACAEAWRKHPCELLNTGFDPECGLPPGTRALGEACFYSRQCASGACGKGNNAALPECGSCVPIGKQGDPCDDGSFACRNGYECTGDGCQPQITFDLPDGALCERFAQCNGDSRCFAEADGMMRCQPPHQLGEDCSLGFCANGSVCGADKRCAFPTPGIGQLCGEVGCAPGGWCQGWTVNPTEAVCIPTVGAGQPCLTQPGVTDPTGNCQDNLFCFCQGVGCAPKCVTLKHEGEACGDAQSSCLVNATCQAGKCVGGELQGLAKAACGE